MTNLFRFQIDMTSGAKPQTALQRGARPGKAHGSARRTVWRLGQARAVLEGNHARGYGEGVRRPGDARLTLQSPVA